MDDRVQRNYSSGRGTIVRAVRLADENALRLCVISKRRINATTVLRYSVYESRVFFFGRRVVRRCPDKAPPKTFRGWPITNGVYGS